MSEQETLESREEIKREKHRVGMKKWRNNNRQKYTEYMREYMRKYRLDPEGRQKYLKASRDYEKRKAGRED